MVGPVRPYPKNCDSAVVNKDSGKADGVDIVPMETSDLLRHPIIKSLIAQRPETGADAAIDLWEQMASEIISIVGEGGFNSLYTRSVFLAQSTFPWLAAGLLAPQTEHPFANLKMSLEGQTPAHASEGNSLLLRTFIDSLAALIGDELALSILRLAWRNELSDGLDKEFKDE